MNYYLLDTSVYGVLADKKEPDYEVIASLIDYAKRNRENFLTTLVIANELDAEDVEKRIKDIVRPEYFLSVSNIHPPIEISHAEKYPQARKLAWNYIQKLEKEDADKVMNDTINYALASIAKVDVFVTRNRRGILAEEYRPVLRRSNQRMRCKFVKIQSPSEFYKSLI